MDITTNHSVNGLCYRHLDRVFLNYKQSPGDYRGLSDKLKVLHSAIYYLFESCISLICFMHSLYVSFICFINLLIFIDR